MSPKTPKTKRNDAPRKRDREGSTKALLEAAVEVFSERGYDAATTREVAKRAGVSEALIQRYFEGKAGLLLAIMQSFSEEEASAWVVTLPFKDTLEEEIRQMLDATCEIHRQHNSFIRVALSRAIVDPKLAYQLRINVHEKRLPAMVARLLHYQQKGLVAKDADLGAIAYGVSAVAFSVGFMGPQVFGMEPARMADIANQLAKILARGAE